MGELLGGISRVEILLSALVLVISLLVILLWMVVRELRRKVLPPEYKVVDIFIMQDPDNHTKCLNDLARDGWSCVAACSIDKHQPEVRYVMSRPGTLPKKTDHRSKENGNHPSNSGQIPESRGS